MITIKAAKRTNTPHLRWQREARKHWAFAAVKKRLTQITILWPADLVTSGKISLGTDTREAPDLSRKSSQRGRSISRGALLGCVAAQHHGRAEATMACWQGNWSERLTKFVEIVHETLSSVCFTYNLLKLTCQLLSLTSWPFRLFYKFPICQLKDSKREREREREWKVKFKCILKEIKVFMNIGSCKTLSYFILNSKLFLFWSKQHTKQNWVQLFHINKLGSSRSVPQKEECRLKHSLLLHLHPWGPQTLCLPSSCPRPSMTLAFSNLPCSTRLFGVSGRYKPPTNIQVAATVRRFILWFVEVTLS